MCYIIVNLIGGPKLATIVMDDSGENLTFMDKGLAEDYAILNLEHWTIIPCY